MRPLRQILRSGYNRLSEVLPAWISGPLDWHLFPHERDPYGGPFNGQQGRAEVFQQILKCFDFSGVVETGTFRGSTTVFLRRVSWLPVYTVEAWPRSFYYARQRFKSESGIHQELGDSRSFLEKLGHTPELSGSVFFYLDAHGGEDLPLSEELQIIARLWADPVIMIDDFEVPDDPAYAYYDPGAGKRLSASYLPRELMRKFCLFWPSMRGEEETGARCGCVVICRLGASEEKLANLSVLRKNSTALLSPAMTPPR